MIRIALLSLAFVAIPDCSSTPAPSAPADAGTVAQRACANLKAVGCPEGSAPFCVHTFDQVITMRLIDLNAPCLSNAKTVAEVRACGPAVECKQ